MAKQRLTANTASNWPGASSRMPTATSGPSIAPAVSIARCTPKAVPSRSLLELSVIRASRGAVRMPLPMRSATIDADSPPRLPPTASSPSRQSAESP